MKKMILILIVLLVLPSVALAAKSATGDKLNVVIADEIQARIDADAVLDERLSDLEDLLQNTDGVGDLIARLQYLEDRLQNSDFDYDGYTPVDGDCDDSNPDFNPSILELELDGIDNNCDGVIDNLATDSDGDGFYFEGSDCDDTDPTVFPGQTEWFADAKDHDCDGLISVYYGHEVWIGVGHPVTVCTSTSPGWKPSTQYPDCGEFGEFVDAGIELPATDGICPEFPSYPKMQLCR